MSYYSVNQPFNADDARQLDALCYDLVLGDFLRGQNRARIQNLANGAPPYTEQEVTENGIQINVNDLTHTRLCHDARTQFYNGFLKTGNFATARTDCGPVHKRAAWGATVTRAWNRRMKGSISYFERMRAEFGMLVLHGISPAVWENSDRWAPRPVGIEDILVPAQTLLGFENLPCIVMRRSFTGPELQKITMKTKRDPGWNMRLVEKCLRWLGQQMIEMRNVNWPEVWAPEKVDERVKEDGGFFIGDQAPHIDMFDIYIYRDDGENSGWIRRIILDSWSEPTNDAGSIKMARDAKGPAGTKFSSNDFVFTSGKKVVARSWQEIASFQFADLSAVFPARYHSVRSLGWLTYASAHLGNRMRCKFYEAVFEALMQYYKVKSADDVGNALRVSMISKGFIDDTMKPMPANERWQVNANLVELGLNDNAGVTSRNSAAFTQQQMPNQNVEKTRFQYMAEMQQMTQLVSAGLNQAYMYQSFEFKEIFRRFIKPRSSDPDVRAFQAECFRGGIPEEILYDTCAWDIESERVMGAGNKTLEMQIAGTLMEWREKFDPEPQRQILRDAVLALTDDAKRADSLVPETPVKVTPSVHDAELVAGSLMQGIPMEPQTGINHIETIETLLRILGGKVQQGLQSGGMVSPQELQGMMNIAGHIQQHIQILAEDKAALPRVKTYEKVLGKIANELRAFEQRLQAQAQKQAQNGNGKIDPKDAAKIQATMLTAQTKAKLASESHAQKTAQRQISFEQKIKQQAREHQASIAKTDLETMATIRRNRLSSQFEEGE